MLPDFNKIPDIYLICGYTDLRKSIDGYVNILQENLSISPMQEAMFLFCNKTKDKLKILYWDKDGFWLLYKRLEQSKFRWPKSSSEFKMLNHKQLEWLLDGLELEQKHYHQELKYKIA